MNHKQKLGYITLGAVIMLIGMWIGNSTSPPLIAQSNGVFDKIQCRSLEVIDVKGKKSIALFASEDSNGIWIVDKASKRGIVLGAYQGLDNAVTIYDKDGKQVAIRLASDKIRGSGIVIYDNTGKTAIDLVADEMLGNEVHVFDRKGNPKWSTLMEGKK